MSFFRRRSGALFITDTDTDSLTGGNDVALVAVELPEPASGLGLAAAMLLTWRRSRRHQ